MSFDCIHLGYNKPSLDNFFLHCDLKLQRASRFELVIKIKKFCFRVFQFFHQFPNGQVELVDDWMWTKCGVVTQGKLESLILKFININGNNFIIPVGTVGFRLILKTFNIFIFSESL